MFESAEVGASIDKKAYKREVPKLRTALLEIQRKLAASDVGLVVLIGGVEGAGKTRLMNQLLEWLDARGVEVHAPWFRSDEEEERPRFWRFWRMIPAKGKAAFLRGSWYTAPIVDRVFRRLGEGDFTRELDRIAGFETMLSQEGIVFVKIWLHLSKEEQKKNLHALAKDPETSWRVTKLDWKYFKKYDRFYSTSEQALRLTGTAEAPWTILEAGDSRYVVVEAARLILKTLKRRFAAPKPRRGGGRAALPKPKAANLLRSLDYGSSLKKKEYRKRLAAAQGRLARLARRLRPEKRSVILVFEGPDAAGKGGAIRRVYQAMDAKLWTVLSVAAPTDEEKAHPYLWRFWRALPRQGRVTIYDRSWYGRVLVERLEGFASPSEWKRAFSEINQFEEQLVEFGTMVLKFWVATTPEEQLRRFKDRQLTPYKQYKITEEDWRNRKKWDAYEAAACEMIERTSTEYAPWIPVPANDKNFARVKVIESVVDRLGKELG